MKNDFLEDEMKITLFSNFMLPHHLLFCRAMVERLGNNFTFVATEPFDSNAVSAGFTDKNMAFSFCLPSYASDVNEKMAHELALESDVIIHGSAPEVFMEERLRANKGISFRYSEHFLRPATLHWQTPRVKLKHFMENTFYTEVLRKKLYYLCASAYVAQDYRTVGAYKNRSYKWGYFPVSSKATIEELREKKPTDKPVILWAGRMLECKHGEIAVDFAAKMKAKGYDFTLQMVGDGPMRKEWEHLSKTLDVVDKVKFLGTAPTKQMPQYMENANIFFFTSDRNEGWGAVLNEAMAAGCAVIADVNTGAAPYLIEHKKNGLLYNDEKTFQKYGQMLLDSPDMVWQFAKQAKTTIDNVWNAQNAADSLIKLSEHLLNGKRGSPILEGPCSVENGESLREAQRAMEDLAPVVVENTEPPVAQQETK